MSILATKNSKISSSFLTKFTMEDSPRSFSLQEKYTIDQLLLDIQSDLLDLLNCKRVPMRDSEKLPQIEDSILYYGLPDLSHYNPASSNDRKKVCDLLQETISRFEKRLKNIYVAEDEEKNKVISTTMHFKINARVNIVPETYYVHFDSVINPSTNDVLIGVG